MPPTNCRRCWPRSASTRQDLARSEPLVLRDMERVCSLCNHKRQCDRDLAAGTAAAHYEEYCGNADTIDGLGPRVKQ